MKKKIIEINLYSKIFSIIGILIIGKYSKDKITITDAPKTVNNLFLAFTFENKSSFVPMRTIINPLTNMIMSLFK